MEQTILDSLKKLENAEVKATEVSTYLSVEFSGSVKIERGVFSMVISFYAKIHETRHKGVITIDDWDINDTSDIMFDGLANEIGKLKAQVHLWGFDTKKLEFTSKEEKIAISKVMLESNELKRVYGENLKVWDLLSVEEQKLLDLQLVIEKFESIGDHLKEQVATHYKIGVQPTPTPTLEEFELKLAELSK